MLIVAHDIRSRENVGALFRTADALGGSELILSGITPTPIDRFGRLDEKLSKVALGAEKTVTWKHVKTVDELLKKLAGYKLYAIEQDTRSVAYHSIKLSEEDLKTTVLLIGNEVTGVPRELLDRADTILEIPMHGNKESLNVAISFAIVAFHLKYSEVVSS